MQQNQYSGRYGGDNDSGYSYRSQYGRRPNRYYQYTTSKHLPQVIHLLKHTKDGPCLCISGDSHHNCDDYCRNNNSVPSRSCCRCCIRSESKLPCHRWKCNIFRYFIDCSDYCSRWNWQVLGNFASWSLHRQHPDGQ